MNKRDFLKLVGLMLLGETYGARAGESRKDVPPKDKQRVVVIGAGLAGLAAARHLHQHGHDVVVVEARDRIGGRIWTSTEWPDMPLDLGATWIHGVRGNPLTELADEIRAARVVTSYDRAHTYNPPDATPQTRRALASPLENRLFFAGEAAEKDYFGTAHGAYLSGLRAAKEIMKP